MEHINGYLNDIGAWRLINIVDLRKKGERADTKTYTTHDFWVAIRKDSKRVFEGSSETLKGRCGSSEENILEGIDHLR